ncbi:MAG: DEAD/DEAH box helicase [Melioribacteraceae bacterium]|nr:DEAD/DEAH box helicase [Melioribacteraceae bacterium]
MMYKGFSDVESNCERMRPWQKEVVGTLSSGVDAYVAAAPGGGKTLPYVCYWLDYVLGLNATRVEERNWNSFADRIYNLFTNPAVINKTLITVPTRSLADQTVQEFKEHFARILVQGISLYLDSSIPNIATPSIENPEIDSNRLYEILKIIDPTDTLNGLMRERERIFRSLAGTRLATGEMRDPDNIHKGKLINDIDQEMQHHISLGIKNIITNMRAGDQSLICLRTGLNNMGDPAVAPVSIAIYESAQKIVNKMPNLALLVTDESHLAQEREIQDDSRRANIAFSLYNILSALKNRNRETRICFLSGTENPDSAQNLANYVEKCFNRQVQVISSSAGNASNISIIPDDSITQDRVLLNIILKPKQSNNLIVLFSKRKIDRLVEIALGKSGRTTSTQIDKGQQQKHQFGGGVIGRGYSGFTRKPGNHPQLNQDSMVKNISRVPGASKIFDPVLREAVNAGFGYIYRVPENDRDKVEKGKDMIIVANLFKTGKIKTLLATDAVGIGVNIDVRNLFIPYIEKMQGGRFQPMKDTELSQLLNRAGRGAFTFSTVITTNQNVPTVSNALSMGIKEFEQTLTIESIPRLACASPKWFVSFWNATVGYGVRKIPFGTSGQLP